LQSPRSWILLARWCGVYSWRIDGLWALPRHIKKWGSTVVVVGGGPGKC
jgi:hypothetical protein